MTEKKKPGPKKKNTGPCYLCLELGEERDGILKGMCRMHYQRDRRGSLRLGNKPHRSLIERSHAGKPRSHRSYRSKSIAEIASDNGIELTDRLIPRYEPMPETMTHDPVIGVVAHQDRYRHASILADRVAAEAISLDDGTLGCEANHRRLWSWLQSSPARWSLILEDDVVVASAFRFQLNQIVAKAGPSIISLYLGRGRPPHQQPAILQAITSLPSEDTCFLSAKDLFSAQGYLVPTAFLPFLLEHTNDGPVPIDEQISAVVRGQGMPVHYTYPSIVEHREDLDPVITQRNDGQPRTERRVAWKFGGRPVWRHIYAPLRTPEELGIKVIPASNGTA